MPSPGAGGAVAFGGTLGVWAVQRWQRLLRSRLGPFLWPPSRRSGAVYLCGSAAAFLAVWCGFIRQRRSREAEAEKRRKREYARASLQNLLRYEAQRKQEEQAADKSEKGEGAAATDPGGKEEGEGEKSKAKKKEAPDAKRLLSLLRDDVEDASVTSLGVDASQGWYTEGLALLKERAEFELREGIKKTKMARDMWTGSDDAAKVEKLEEWQDGEKLAEKVRLMTGDVQRAFGKGLVDKALLREAKELVRKVAAQKKAALRRILALFAPHAWKWCVGTALLMFTECMIDMMFARIMHMTTLVYSGLPAEQVVRQAARTTMGLGIAFLFWWPIDNTGDFLVDGVEAKMQLELRNAVMKCLLSQDREFFDHHQSGVLQDRLNTDTEVLARTIIQQPKDIISALTRLVVKSFWLYTLSPRLFWLGISIPVPFCVICNTAGWHFVRRSDRKIGKINDQAAGSTSEILREISTVRQFGMEQEEHARYWTVAAWREQLEFSLHVLKRFTFHLMWMSWIASRAMNTFWGVSMTVRGTGGLTADMLLLAVYQFDGMIW